MSLVSCDSVQEQRLFNDAVFLEPQGYTFTDEGGGLPLNDKGDYISFDDDDWRIGPGFTGSVSVDPAYPNPSDGNLIILPISINDFDGFPGGLFLRAFDNSNPPLLRQVDEIFDASAGSFAFRFDPSLLSIAGDISSIRGLHRLFVMDAQGNLVSYGDLLIQ